MLYPDKAQVDGEMLPQKREVNIFGQGSAENKKSSYTF